MENSACNVSMHSYATLSIYDLTRYNGMSSTTEFIDLDFLRVADIEEESGALFDIEGDSMVCVTTNNCSVRNWQSRVSFA